MRHFRIHGTAVGLQLLVILAICNRSFAANDVAGSLITFTQNGGWSWFQDPRVIVDNHQLIIGSVAGTTANGATAGDIRVTSYSLATQTPSTFTLHSALQQDDHDVPAFVVLPDGRYLAVFQRHGTDNLVRGALAPIPAARRVGVRSKQAVPTRPAMAMVTHTPIRFI